MNLYDRIKSRRIELNISQQELAEILGYQSRSSINKIEQGINDIPQSKIKDFAEALNTTPAWLMGYSVQEDESSIIARNILFYRKKYKMSLDKFAEEIGITSDTLSYWESGTASFTLEDLQQLCSFLGVTIFELTHNTTATLSGKLSDKEYELLYRYRILNNLGKEKAAEYITDLSENPKYTATENKINTHIELVADSTECTILYANTNESEIID